MMPFARQSGVTAAPSPIRSQVVPKIISFLHRLQLARSSVGGGDRCKEHSSWPCHGLACDLDRSSLGFGFLREGWVNCQLTKVPVVHQLMPSGRF